MRKPYTLIYSVLLALVAATVHVWADELPRTLRYWFDGNTDDIHTVAATPVGDSVAVVNMTADVSSLGNYLHTIHFQVGDEQGGWSVPVTQFFLKMPPTADEGGVIASQMRYWFDGHADNVRTVAATDITDSLATLSMTADVSSLGNYLHTIHIQVGDEDGGWSVPVTQFFLKMPPTADEGGAIASQMRYWFDGHADIVRTVAATDITDSLATLSMTADVSSLGNYLHTIHFQVGDEDGGWSVPVTQFFLKMPATPDEGGTIASQMRYWFDGHADNVRTVAATDITDSLATLSMTADVSSLGNYLHTIHFQVGDEQGGWSVPVTQFFLKMPAETEEEAITNLNVLYSFDEGRVLETNGTRNDSTATFNLDIRNLTIGAHTVTLIVRNGTTSVMPPVYAEFTKELAAQEIQIALHEGWNWISFNIPSDSIPSPVNALASLNGQFVLIQGQHQQLVNDPKAGILGSLKTLEPSLAYKLLMTEDATLALSTTAASIADTPVNLYQGWNWLGYVPAEAMLLSDALAGLPPSEGDVIKSQTEFAVYENGQWMGTLSAMEPGQGYLYNAAEMATFYYQFPTAAHTRPAIKAEKTEMMMPWQFNAYAYPDNMTLIARLADVDEEILNDRYVLAAFCEDECRGVARVIDGRLFMTIHGAITDREQIRFRVYDREECREFRVRGQMTFGNRMEGSPADPVVLHLDESSAVEEILVNAMPEHTEYYSLQGFRVALPVKGHTYVVVVHTTAGRIVRKVVRYQ